MLLHRDPPAPKRAGAHEASPEQAWTPIHYWIELEADHRRHAEVENAIRGCREGVGLQHLPSGRFTANGARLAMAVMAHDAARWPQAERFRVGLARLRELPATAG